MPLVLPRRSLNLDFVRDGQASGDNYPTELSKLDGLLTFARVSTATRFNATGNLETVAAGQPRFDFDPVTLACKGLLIEEARTNSILHANDLANAAWTKTNVVVNSNVATALDGTATADEVEDSAVTGAHRISQSVAARTVGQTEVLSCVVAAVNGVGSIQLRLYNDGTGGSASETWARFDIGAGTLTAGTVANATITALGSGRYRCSLKHVNTGTTIAAFYEHYVGGESYLGTAGHRTRLQALQLEAGSFATSYIPTTAAAVTRAAETFSTSSLAPWFNASEGTVLADFETRGTVPSGTNFHVWALDDGGDNNRLMLRAESGGLTAFVTAGAVVQASFNFGANVAQRQRVGLIYALNNFAASRDGATAVTDNAGSVPAVTTLRLGHERTNTQHLNGWLRRLVYLPYPASVTLLKALST